MINIAICDDDAAMTTTIEELLYKNPGADCLCFQL